jgi:hypothetical protein
VAAVIANRANTQVCPYIAPPRGKKGNLAVALGSTLPTAAGYALVLHATNTTQAALIHEVPVHGAAVDAAAVSVVAVVLVLRGSPPEAEVADI